MSERLTIKRIKDRSLVPHPLMALCKRSAKYAGRLLAHFTENSTQELYIWNTSQLNVFLI
jgi:hypothetical protein